MKEYLPLLGRFGLTLIFIVNGLHKFLEFGEFEMSLLEMGLPLAAPLLILAASAEVLGGLLILIGYKTGPVSFALAIYVIMTTIFFHPIWFDLGHYTDFVKNMAITGGLLTLAYHGPGPKSMDSHHLW